MLLHKVENQKQKSVSKAGSINKALQRFGCVLQVSGAHGRELASQLFGLLFTTPTNNRIN